MAGTGLNQSFVGQLTRLTGELRVIRGGCEELSTRMLGNNFTVDQTGSISLTNCRLPRSPLRGRLMK